MKHKLGRFKKLSLPFATSRVIASFNKEEESPDSAEQCTGEEPGVSMKIGITDSATENNYSE
jgi:hypothetical protein